jgi:hypothetical protein
MLRRGSESYAVRAQEISDADERARLWRIVCEGFPLYETYQRRTARVLPLFVLVRAS